MLSVNEARNSGYESIADENDRSESPNPDEPFYLTFNESSSSAEGICRSKTGMAALGLIAFVGTTVTEALLIPPHFPSVPFAAVIAAAGVINGVLIGTIECLLFKALFKKAPSSALSYSDGVYTIQGTFDLSSVKLSRGVAGQWARDGYKVRFGNSKKYLSSLKEFEEELKIKGLISYRDLLETLSTQGPIDAEIMQVTNLVREQRHKLSLTEFFSVILSGSRENLHTEPVCIIHDLNTHTTKIQTKMARKTSTSEGEEELLGTYHITLVVEWDSLKKLLTIAPLSHKESYLEEISIQ